MVNSKMLRSKMVLFGDTNESLAEALHISKQTISAKITGKIDFWQTEIKEIALRYNLTPDEVDKIFFAGE